MDNKLNIALIQSDLVWENPEQNRDNFTKKIDNIKEEVDVVILPEMFTTGFTMNAETVAETMDGETVSWMKELASKTDAAIVGSIVISENNKFYNRLLFVEPSGFISYYDKRHTFTLLKARAIENMCYCIGVNRVGVDGVNSLYSGHSAVYDVLGEVITSFKPNEEDTQIVTLEKRHIQAYRNKLKFLDDRDTFSIT